MSPRSQTVPRVAPSPLAALRARPISSEELAHRALERDWAKRMKIFQRLVDKGAGALSDDDVHDLRVTTRRLRASLWVLRHCMESNTGDRAHRELRSIGKVLGERRMWDIALGDAQKYGADTRAIEKKRARAHTKLRRALRGARVRSVLKDMQKLEEAVPGLMLERLVPWLQGYEWELAYRLQKRPKTPAERHALRIQAKKVRYVLECLGRKSARLEKLQDHLGREHDLDVVQGLIGRKRGLAGDRRNAATGANRVMQPALHSGIRELRALQKDLSRWR
jgi:CHAD domain-containing protein